MTSLFHFCIVKQVQTFCQNQITRSFMTDNIKIGIIGTGSFGTKLMQYAANFGFNVSLMDKNVDALCASQKSLFVSGDPMEFEDVVKFGEQVDLLTVLDENVNVPALELLQRSGTKIFPSPETIELLQDKYLQKKFLKENNIPIVTGWYVTGNTTPQLVLSGDLLQNEMHAALAQDQMVVDTIENLSNDPEVYMSQVSTVSVKLELRVVVSRNENGVIECYDPALMILDHGKMFVDFDACPSGRNNEMALDACMLAARLAESLNLRGMMAVDIILTGNGRMYVNDLTLRQYECVPTLQIFQADSKASLLTRLLLNLPEQEIDSTEIWSKLAIIEPAAYRKNTFETALKTVLCMGDDVHGQSDEIVKLGKIRSGIRSDQAIDGLLSKAIVIRHLLHGAQNNPMN
jgi:5-(carboxyamino)imidazole ribonucleotide synthase